MKVVLWPNPILKTKCEVVTTIPPMAHFEEMHRLMKESGGVGLAAPQIGDPRRYFILDVGNGLEVYINPTFQGIWASGTERKREGCLSTPTIFADIPRWSHISVSFLNQDGAPTTGVEFSDSLRTQAFQHEAEHLDGVMYIDHVSSAERSRIRGEMRRLRKSGRL
jgi:peptide deformylase